MLNQLWHDLWILLFIILIIIGVFAAQGLVIGFGSMGLLVAGISWMWNRLSLEEVFYERQLSHRRVFIGEEVKISLSLTNKKPLPLGKVLVEDEIPLSLSIPGADIVGSPNPDTQTMRHSTSMAWYERVSWEYSLTPSRRGYYRLGPARIESGDLFGFFTSVETVTGSDYLLVYPQIVPLPELGLPAMRPLGESKGGQRIYEDASRPQGLRDYQMGDPLKIIDWKATARFQELQVRTFEPSISMNVTLAVAVDTTAHYWEGYSPTYLERIITTAASVASYAAEMQYTLGMFSNGTPVLADRPMKIPPSRSPEQLTVILEALATIQPLAMGGMASQLDENWRKFPVGSTVVLISAYIPEELTEVVHAMRRNGHKVVVLYIGNEELPQFEEGVTTYGLHEHFEALELAGEFSPR